MQEQARRASWPASSTWRSSSAARRSTRSGVQQARGAVRLRLQAAGQASVFPWEAPFHPADVAHDVFQALAHVRDLRQRAACAARCRARRLPPRAGGAVAPFTEVAAANPEAWFRVERDADDILVARRPTTGWSAYAVHQVHDLAYGRRHGRCRRAREPRPGRRAGRPAGAARLPAGLVLRDRPGVRRRAPRSDALTGDGGGEPRRRSVSRARHRRLRAPRSLHLLRPAP